VSKKNAAKQAKQDATVKQVKQDKQAKQNAAAKQDESETADAAAKRNPPESIRKLIRPIYKQTKKKMGYISMLYDIFRTSYNDSDFLHGLDDIFNRETAQAVSEPMLDIFQKYRKMMPV
jgi:hypothetical protein